jgi:WD40 repeat protein
MRTYNWRRVRPRARAALDLLTRASCRLWDVATGQWLATVAQRKAGAERNRFLPDGRRLAIGYQDGEVEIRDLYYYFRYAAGHADYQLRLLHAGGERFPLSGEGVAWSRRLLP